MMFQTMRPADTLIHRMFDIDARSLAVFRIGIAIVVLTDLFVLRYPGVHAFYADDGMYPLAIRAELQETTWSWSLHALDGSAGFQTTLFAVAAVFAVLLLFGFQTRLATIVLWVLTVSLANRNLLACNYGDTVLRLFLFWSMFLPLNATWSVDAVRRAKRGRRLSARGPICSMATACALFQLTILYSFAGLWKVNEDWMSGTAMYHALSLEYATRPSTAALLQWTWLLKPLTQATLVLELLGPLLVWSPWATNRLRMAMIVAFIGLHVSIEMFFTPGILSYVCICAWFLFLPTAFWDSRWPRVANERWETWLARQKSSAAPSTTAEDRTEQRLRPVWRCLLSGVCGLLLGYVLLWNIATLDLKRFGFLLPEPLRGPGHTLMLRQTWDMFYVPSRHNGWFSAQAHLKNGEIVDVLRHGEPVAGRSTEHNWNEMPNARWRFFLRRVGAEGCDAACQPVAEYLLRSWNERRQGAEHAFKLNLVYNLWLDEAQDGQRDFGSRVVATADTGEVPDPDLFLQKLEAFGRDGPLLP